MIHGELFEFIAANQSQIAAVVAGASALLLYGVIGRRWLGADDTWWNALRRTLLPWLDERLENTDIYASYELRPREFVGTVDLSVAEVNEELERMGFDRNPIAAMKYAPDGRPERASWALRDLPEYFDDLPPLAQSAVAALQEDQLHVMLFTRPDGRTDIAVHHEVSSINPRKAADHYEGDGYDVQKGNEQFRQLWGRETKEGYRAKLTEWQQVVNVG